MDKLHKNRVNRLAMLAAAFVMLFAISASAAPISGSSVLDVGNGAVAVTGNGTTFGCINFYTVIYTDSCQARGGSFNVIQGSSPFVIGDSGIIQDLPFGLNLPFAGFMNIPAEGIDFDLTAISSNNGPSIGSCTYETGDTTPGATCTAAGSPFVLTNGLIDPATGVVDTVGILFNINVIGYRGSSKTGYTQYIGVFTTQSPESGNIDTILQSIASGNPIQASWSATFAPTVAVATTAEPFSSLLCALGLGLFGFAGRRSRRARC